MNVIAVEKGGSRPDGISWSFPSLVVGGDAESRRIGNDQYDTSKSSIPLINTFLPKIIQDLAFHLPALNDVDALSVWFFQEESTPLPLLNAGLPVIMRALLGASLDVAVTGWIKKNQRLLVISAENEKLFPGFYHQLLECGIQSFCAIPLTDANRQIGFLGLASTKTGAFQNLTTDHIEHPSAAPDQPMDANCKPLTQAKLNAQAIEGSRYFEAELSADQTFQGIIGNSTPILEVRKAIKVVAPTDSTVLILGETGTGKERIAQAIHNLSSRREHPFIKVNCAAIPAGLIESELFGHERGSFTGAVGRRIGRFEMANGGTLFLDEIGDIPLELQPKLLRVLQEQEFERLGGTQTTRVDVRVVAATSRDLPRMTANKEFRGDLYYRLNVFPLRVPPLRERAEDIVLLVRHFTDFYAKRMGKQVKDIPTETMEVLSRYVWPGNVRELQNVIERAVIISAGTVLTPALDELRQHIQIDEAIRASDTEITKFEDAAREHIIQALAATNWVLGGPNGAGARLGLARSTLVGKMHRLGITREQA